MIRFIGNGEFIIAQYAFKSQNHIKKVIFDGEMSVTFLNYCFKDRNILVSVDFGKAKVKSIGIECFYNTGIQEIYIPNASILYERSSAECSKLTTVHIFNTNSIAHDVFQDSSSLVYLSFCGNEEPGLPKGGSRTGIFTLSAEGSFATSVTVEVLPTYKPTKFMEVIINNNDKKANVFEVGTATFTPDGTKATITGSGEVNKNLFDQKVKCPCFADDLTSLVFNGDNAFTIKSPGFRDCSSLTTVSFNNK